MRQAYQGGAGSRFEHLAHEADTRFVERDGEAIDQPEGTALEMEPGDVLVTPELVDHPLLSGPLVDWPPEDTPAPAPKTTRRAAADTAGSDS